MTRARRIVDNPPTVPGRRQRHCCLIQLPGRVGSTFTWPPITGRRRKTNAMLGVSVLAWDQRQGSGPPWRRNPAPGLGGIALLAQRQQQAPVPRSGRWPDGFCVPPMSPARSRVSGLEVFDRRRALLIGGRRRRWSRFGNAPQCLRSVRGGCARLNAPPFKRLLPPDTRESRGEFSACSPCGSAWPSRFSPLRSRLEPHGQRPRKLLLCRIAANSSASIR